MPTPKHSTPSPIACPACGSRERVPIVFGYPGSEMFEDSEKGKIVLGGCVVGGDDPTWHCSACGRQWA